MGLDCCDGCFGGVTTVAYVMTCCLVQCPVSCNTDAACLANKVVTKGIAAPLEVFKTQKCG